MSKASDITIEIQTHLRKLAKADPDARGHTLENILAANRRRRIEGRKPQGRPPSPPRLVLVGKSLFIRHLEKDTPTHVVLQAGMDADEAYIAAAIELDRFIERLNARDRIEISHTDKTLREINDDYIKAKASSASFNVNKTRRRYAEHLELKFPAKTLGEVVRGSGDAYLADLIASVEDEDKRKTLHNTAVDRLRFQAKAIEYYYDNLTDKPDQRRGYDIQEKFKRKSEVTLTFEQLMRLDRAAQGWSYDLATGEWTEDPDPDLEVIRRWIWFYFYTGTRGATLNPLQWGSNLDGGFVDAAKGIIYRKPPGAESTNKRATPARLLGSLRDMVKEWEREDFENEWIHIFHDAAGGEISNMRWRFNKVKKKAGLDWMHPHDLKHTGVSLLSHAGLDIKVIADAMATRAETLRNEYEHLEFLFVPSRTSGSEECDVSIERLAKTSPPDAHGWKLRAARHKKRQAEAARKRKAARAASPDAAGELADAVV